MGTYTADLFMTLDGFGIGPVGYWGKSGPELVAERARTFFGATNEALVFGGNTYRAMARFAAAAGDDPNFAALDEAPKLVISTTLTEPLPMRHTTLVAADALAAVPRLKAESPVPLRSHGSIAMDRALLAAGLVDRLEVTVFPVITGVSGGDPVFTGLPDIDLDLVESRVLDGHIQRLVYVPTGPWDGSA